MNSGIYSLVVRNTYTNEFVVLPIEDLNDSSVKKEKVNISSIDKVTTFFKDEQHLIEHLIEKGYINFSTADIFIKYKQDGKDKLLEPLYEKFNVFRLLTEDNESKIKSENQNFIYYQDIIFQELNKKSVRNYILNSYNVNYNLKKHIIYMYDSNHIDDVTFFKKKIIEDLLNYRTLRDVVSSIDEYYNKEKKVNRLMKNEDRRRALVGEITKDEEELLARTMNINIPLDYSLEESQVYKDASIYKSNNEEVKEMIDLDDIIYGLSYVEALALGIDLNKMDEYVGKTKK